MAKVKNLASNTDSTILRVFFYMFSQNPQPNIAARTCDLLILKPLLRTFPHVQTKLKQVKKWQTGQGQNPASNTDFTHFRTFFHTSLQTPQPNIAAPTCDLFILKPLLSSFPFVQTKLKKVKK